MFVFTTFRYFVNGHFWLVRPNQPKLIVKHIRSPLLQFQFHSENDFIPLRKDVISKEKKFRRKRLIFLKNCWAALKFSGRADSFPGNLILFFPYFLRVKKRNLPEFEKVVRGRRWNPTFATSRHVFFSYCCWKWEEGKVLNCRNLIPRVFCWTRRNSRFEKPSGFW